MLAKSQLTTAERRMFERCVETISAGLPIAGEVFKAIETRAAASQVIASGRLTTMEVAKALAQIKDAELWREAFASWTEFVRRSLKVTIRQADRLVIMHRKAQNPSLDISEECLGSYPVTQGSNPPAWESQADAPPSTAMDAVGQELDRAETDEAPRQPNIASGKSRIAAHILALRKLVGVLTTAPACISALDALEDALAAAPELIGA